MSFVDKKDYCLLPFKLHKGNLWQCFQFTVPIEFLSFFRNKVKLVQPAVSENIFRKLAHFSLNLLKYFFQRSSHFRILWFFFPLRNMCVGGVITASLRSLRRRIFESAQTGLFFFRLKKSFHMSFRRYY